MPYPNKRYSKHSNKSMKKHYKKKVPSNKSLAKDVKVIKNQMMEKKYHDVVFPSATITTAGTGAYWTSPCLMIQGDNVETRNANRIYTRNFELKAFVSADLDRVAASAVRMIVFWDNTPNGSLPVIIGTPTALLDDSLGTITAYFAYPNMSTNRYTILCDERYILNPSVIFDTDITTGTTNSVAPRSFNIEKSFSTKRVVQYNGPLGTIVELSNNGIFVAWICASSVDAPTVTGSARLLYNDA